MNNREKYKLVYSNYAKPIWELAEAYENSFPMVENKLNNRAVISAFNTLRTKLQKQLNDLTS